MNGSHPPRRTSRGEDLSPPWAWGSCCSAAWPSGGGSWAPRARMEWLSSIGRASGYGPVPRDMVEQIEWLVDATACNDLYGDLPVAWS